jgi:hypothetical protein
VHEEIRVVLGLLIDDTGFPKKMLWGRRRDSCKIVASINGH